MSEPTPSVAHRRAALALLLLAIVLRLLATQYARFTGDEGDQWSKAVRIAQLDYFPALGQPITGSVAMTPGPAFEYIMALPQLLGPSVWLGTVFTVLLNVLAVWLFYLLALRFGGPRAGLLALLLGACSPWAIVYSEKIWSANVLPLWGTLTVYAAVRAPESPRWQAALILLAGALPQVHLSAPALWVGCAVWLLLTPRFRLSPKWILVGVGLTVLAYLPTIVYELRHDFANTKAILQHGGGKESAEYVRTLPLRVLGAAVGQGTSELSYQLLRGYWEFTGGYDGYRMFTTREGFARLLELYGPLAGALTLVSVLLAVSGWASAARRSVRCGLEALRARDRAALPEGERFTIALLASLASAILLMALSKKTFFPHYLAFLIPALVWPVVSAGARWLECRTFGPAVRALVLISAVSMVANAARYYRDVDSLDGLRNSLAILSDILESDAPASVQFEHFNNLYSWERLARYHFGRPLLLRETGAVRYLVRNRAAHQGPVPEGAKLYGGRLLVERDARGALAAPESIVLRGARDFTAFSVTKTTRAGELSTCRPDPRSASCGYGPNPWERFGPELLRFSGRPQSVLFMHPIAGSVVRAELQPPAEARRGRLYAGLTDEAMASGNRAPVRLRLTNGARVLLEAEVGTTRGLQSFPFTLSSTVSLALEIETANDGARVFGFDLDLAR